MKRKVGSAPRNGIPKCLRYWAPNTRGFITASLAVFVPIIRWTSGIYQKPILKYSCATCRGAHFLNVDPLVIASLLNARLVRIKVRSIARDQTLRQSTEFLHCSHYFNRCLHCGLSLAAFEFINIHFRTKILHDCTDSRHAWQAVAVACLRNVVAYARRINASCTLCACPCGHLHGYLIPST